MTHEGPGTLYQVILNAVLYVLSKSHCPYVSWYLALYSTYGRLNQHIFVWGTTWYIGKNHERIRVWVDWAIWLMPWTVYNEDVFDFLLPGRDTIFWAASTIREICRTTRQIGDGTYMNRSKIPTYHRCFLVARPTRRVYSVKRAGP